MLIVTAMDTVMDTVMDTATVMATATVVTVKKVSPRVKRRKTNNSVDHGIAYYYNLQLRPIY